jgi:predicted small integral membrane protein
MRVFKSLLVFLIGLTALMYVLQSLASVGEMRQHIEALPSPATSPVLSWMGFMLVTLIQFALAATALKGAWELFAARNGSPEMFKGAKTTAVWAGGLSLLSWFALSLMVGAGLFQWGTDGGDAALAKSFALGTTSALTILFVWGTTD